MDAEQTASVESRLEVLQDTDRIAAAWRSAWLTEAEPGQLPPQGDDWGLWLLLGGRGAGKTRPLVEESAWIAWRHPGIRVHALAPTLGDVKRVLWDGESGYRAKVPPQLIAKIIAQPAEIHLINGSVILGFSMTEEADRLRGPQCHMLVCDEAAAADKPAGNLEAVWKVAKLGCRLPFPDRVTRTRKLMATTPRPIPFLRRLMEDPETRVTRRTTYDNLKNLSQDFAKEVLSFEGTRYGRQEIHGQIIADEEIGIFKRSWFRLWPADKEMPEFNFVLMTMDTAFEEESWDSKKQEPDFSACGVFGVFNTKQVFTEQERRKLGIRHTYSAVLADFWMERLGFPELLTKARQSYRTKYGKPGRYPNVVLIENKASGISLRQTLQTFNVPVWPFNPGNQSKLMRAHASSPYIMQGSLFVPESMDKQRKGQLRDWAEPLVEQCCAYAGKGSTEFDDGLDVLTSTTLYLASTGMIEATPDQGAFPDPDEKEERDQREAMRLADEERRGRVSPYGV